MHRTPVIAANWKMHSPPQGWEAADAPYAPREGVEVIVLPSFIDIAASLAAGFVTGAQAGRPEPEGSFTGDVSMRMLADRGCRYVLCGHSGRRIHHGEDDTFIARQVEAAAAAGLVPILCVGETADERAAGQAQAVVERQLASRGGVPDIIIAYEPVWAIGTGNTASEQDVQEMHVFIRSLLPDAARADMRILYGGSVKPENAAGLIAQPDIDGFLVGGASLVPADFGKIIDACAAAA